MIIREGQRKVIMPDRIGGRERERGILCAGEETETATPGAPARPRKTANPRNYLEVSCFRLTRAFETSGINSVPYYRFRVTGSTGKDSPKSPAKRRPPPSPGRSPRSIASLRSIFDLSSSGSGCRGALSGCKIQIRPSVWPIAGGGACEFSSCSSATSSAQLRMFAEKSTMTLDVVERCRSSPIPRRVDAKRFLSSRSRPPLIATHESVRRSGACPPPAETSAANFKWVLMIANDSDEMAVAVESNGILYEAIIDPVS